MIERCILPDAPSEGQTVDIARPTQVELFVKMHCAHAVPGRGERADHQVTKAWAVLSCAPRGGGTIERAQCIALTQAMGNFRLGGGAVRHRAAVSAD